MSKDVLTKFKWFWYDQDEAQEQWLRQMAQQGWHMRSVFGVLWRFDWGSPADVVYRTDYLRKAPAPDYQQLLQDAGWEHVTESGGWHYWRAAAVPGQTQELFTDMASRRAKFTRLLPIVALGVLPSIMFLASGKSRKHIIEELSWPFALVWWALLAIIVIGLARLTWHLWRTRQPS